jgi:CelD/BcsL family acetyltransferase involved in cellulose biosynthesis
MRPNPTLNFVAAESVNGVLALESAGERFRVCWQSLAEHAAEANSFYEPWAVIPSALQSSRPIRLIHAGRKDAATAILPISIERNLGRWPIRHAAAWNHDHCFLSTPLVAQGSERAAWRDLLAAADDSELPGFLSFPKLTLDGAVFDELQSLCAEQGRGIAILQRHERAWLASPDCAESYMADRLSGKKRKELRRLANRLGDEGTVTRDVWSSSEALEPWVEEYLALEAAGWKGRNASAIADNARDVQAFRDTLTGAAAAGRLEMLRLAVDGRAIAILVNFRAEPGSFSYKIAYDESFSRYSPGVMIEIDNLARIASDPAIAWMDSCAAPDHPMIDHLWGERRSIGHVVVALRGPRRALAWSALLTLERLSALARRKQDPAA